jgi:sugar phosphate isomerase/epimerase
MNHKLSRRDVLIHSGIVAGAGAMALPVAAASMAGDDSGDPFRYCLNTGTIMRNQLDGRDLTIVDEVEVAAKAGYSGIEPWLRKLHQYVEQGNSLSDLRKRIADRGLIVESAIGFAAWGVDDPQRRAKALDDLKRDMDLIAQIGGQRIAAPPAGINRQEGMDLRQVAQRYHTVLELGREMGVLPQLEIWGSALTLGRMSEAAFVAIQAGHVDACLLLDAYHLYKGGSDFDSLRLLNGAAMHVFHINDYPADPPREEIRDEHRVFPGDGVAPLDTILATLHATGFRGALSLELFNRSYWQRDVHEVAREGLEKMMAAVQRAVR